MCYFNICGIILFRGDFPCGSGLYWAVYSTEGPYLTHVTTSVDADWLVAQVPVAIDTWAYFSKIVNISKGKWYRLVIYDRRLVALYFDYLNIDM